MKLHKLYVALFCSLFTLASDAFAIDQLVLKNGTIIEGKILSEVPNRHVDIQLVNGSKRRYNATDVSSVERDVPSNVDSHMAGGTAEMFFGATVGMYKINLTGSDLKFNWGARFGINATQLDDFAKLAFALSYNSTTFTSATGTASATISEMMIQALFRKVGNTGFYFGPEFGLLFASASVGGTSLGSDNTFGYGGLLGYDYYTSDSFSFGPEVHFTSNQYFDQFKFLMGFTGHF